MADLATETKFVTEEELMALGSDARVEVVDGVIVDLPGCGLLHHIIAGNLFDPIDHYVRDHKTGIAFIHGLLYILKKEGDAVINARVPDISFLRKEQVSPRVWEIESFPRVAPTLAIEITSPDDNAEALLRKVRDYLGGGTAQVWVVFAEAGEVHVYRRGVAQVHTYSGSDVMDVSDLFPGLKLPLSDIFSLSELDEA